MSDRSLPQNIPLTQLHPHPQNPRLAIRDDVVAAIAANLADGFDPAHALIVRPNGDGYQIISGHHRKAAAEKVGLDTAPCWVRDLNDEDAYMALATSNSQGELSPLEIGMHALHCVELGKGGAGKKGGLSAYAEAVGRGKSTITESVNAARVVENCSVDRTVFNTKTQHLAAIHALPRTLWQIVAAVMLESEWSAADTKHYVTIIREFDIPEEWAVYLPLREVVKRYLDTREFSPSTIKKLVAQANRLMGLPDVYFSGSVAESEKATIKTWLENEKPWDVRKLIEKERALDAAYRQDLIRLQNDFRHGRWQDHIGELADGSVALLLTDPPYGMSYRSDHRLDRRIGRKHERIEGDDRDTAIAMLGEMLTAIETKLTSDAHLLIFCGWKTEPAFREVIESVGYTIRGSLVWVKNNTGMGDPNTTFAPKHERILHAVKGSPALMSRLADVFMEDRADSSRHPTEKPVPLLKKLIETASVEGELVADPFAGVASTLVAAKSTGRKFWGCEVSEQYHKSGMQRLDGDQ